MNTIPSSFPRSAYSICRLTTPSPPVYSRVTPPEGRRWQGCAEGMGPCRAVGLLVRTEGMALYTGGEGVVRLCLGGVGLCMLVGLLVRTEGMARSVLVALPS